jgi:hypothetical protein
LETHIQLLDAHQIMSGRCRGYVYWWHNGKLHWRRYVVPRDPRTPAQRRSRAAFGEASTAWSENQPLTEAQRDAWYAAAEMVKSRPRLGLSGFRTAQQHFVGSNSLKERWGLPLLLELPERERKHAKGGRQSQKAAPQAPELQRLKATSRDPRRAFTGPPPDLHREPNGRVPRPSALRVPIQVTHCQALARPSSERPQPPSRPFPVRCLCQVRFSNRFGSIGSPRASPTLTHVHRSARFRELWRGG